MVIQEQANTIYSCLLFGPVSTLLMNEISYSQLISIHSILLSLWRYDEYQVSSIIKNEEAIAE